MELFVTDCERLEFLLETDAALGLDFEALKASYPVTLSLKEKSGFWNVSSECRRSRTSSLRGVGQRHPDVFHVERIENPDPRTLNTCSPL